MKLQNFIDGMLIFQKYHKSDDYCIGADHDIFYVYATDAPIGEDDLTKLYELGWFQPDVEETEDEEHGPYDPEEGWAAYT